MACPPKAAQDNRKMERSDSVLWTLSPTGIVLHNFRIRRYLELDQVGYRAWALLAGARTVDEVIERSVPGSTSTRSATALSRRLRQTIQTMAAHGFLQERPDG